MIPVYEPSLTARERELLLEAFDSGWISGRGEFIHRFEAAFADTVGARYAVSVSNGTVALTLALHALGIGNGDEVVLPAYTYVACANTVRLAGATPVFTDATPDAGQVDLDDVVRHLTPRTKAVLVPHLFGTAQDLTALAAHLDTRGIFLVEDCSESLGARIHGRPVGRNGRLSTHSFFGNKTITTGEGGMVTTDDVELADLLRRLRNQGIATNDQYFHDLVAFNFRMTNLQAALGVAQLERLEWILARKRALASKYRDQLEGSGLRFIGDPRDGVSSHWLVTAFLPDGIDRRALIERARLEGVDVRPGFVPMYHLPMYAQDPRAFPNTERFHASVICLPSYPTITDDDLARVVEVVRLTLGA